LELIELCWLIVYGGDDNDGERDESGRIGGGDCCSESIDSVSDFLPNSYSELDIFLYKG